MALIASHLQFNLTGYHFLFCFQRNHYSVEKLIITFWHQNKHTTAQVDGSYLKKHRHGSYDALLLDGRAQAVKVVRVVQVNLHLQVERRGEERGERR